MGGGREGRGGVGVRLRKGILARVSVPCVSHIILFNRTRGRAQERNSFFPLCTSSPIEESLEYVMNLQYQ